MAKGQGPFTGLHGLLDRTGLMVSDGFHRVSRLQGDVVVAWTGLHGLLDRDRGNVSMKVSMSRLQGDVVGPVSDIPIYGYVTVCCTHIWSYEPPAG